MNSYTQLNFLFRSFLFLFLFGTLSYGNAQNLVPNYSFETFTTCPTQYEGLCFLYAPPWSCASLGSADLFNSCGNPSMAGVPDNAIGSQLANTGEGYAGFICFWPSISNYREYPMVQLTAPLIAGEWYYVSFFISVADSGCGVENVGAHFSTSSIYQSQFTTLNVTPQIENTTGMITDNIGWVFIGGCFQAAGGEQFMTIGNFYNDNETPLDPDCSGTYNYFYVDDVSVVQGGAPEEIMIELGDPIVECFSYEIDPEHDGPFFLWSDGSTGPTLVVTESGVYTLTVTDGCNQGVDSVEVTILGTAPPVELGPADVIICAGEEYTLSLDPDLETYTWSDGSNDPEYSITTTGTYSVTLDDGCQASTDEVNVIVLDPPSPFTLGEDAFLCSGDEIEIVFDPTLGDFLWQDGNTSSTYTIDIGGDYSLTISNICGMETDDLVISDLEVPDVQIGPDEQTICSGDILEIEIDPDLGDILWQDGSSEPNYEITAPGVYSVFVTNQCGTGSDQIDVTVIISPNVELGPDTVLCAGEELLLSTTNAGPYLWQDNSTADTFLVTGPGTYSLAITNFCGIASDVIEVEYIDALVPPAFGPDVSLCPGEQIVLHANNQGASYLWQDFTTADSILVTTSGTYFVQIFNSCFLVADTIAVTVNASPPQVDLPAQLSLCQGQTITLDAVVSGVNYLWNDNSQNQQLLVNTPGTYSVTVSNSCGTDVDTTIIMDGGPAPAVEIGSDVQFCTGDNILLSPVFSNVTSWLWQDGSTLPTYNITSAGSVTVAVSNSCGTAFDTLQATLLPATPPLDLGADTSLCTGESFVLSINTPGVTVVWPDGSTGANYNVSGAGFVFAAITNSCGSSFDTILVDALPDVPLLDLGNDQSLCPGEIISVSPGISNVQYLWQDGSTGNTYQSTQEETIILTISNNCGVSTDTLEVTESTQGPQLDLGLDIQVCSGETVTIQSGIAGVTYLWQDGSTNPDFTTAQSGVFILEVNNNCGSATDTIVVDISGVPPTPVLPADTTLCEGITLLLTSTADAETSIEWQNGSSASTFTVTSAGVYTLAETNRCGDAADTITVAYLDAPDPFTLGPDTTLCPGETLTLNAPSTSYTILWQDGSDQVSIVANQAATYSLQISNECGMVMDELVLDYDTRVPQLNLLPSVSWCPGDIVTLDASQPFPAAYIWSTGATTASIQIVTPGVYTIDVAAPCSIVTMDVDVYVGDCTEPDVHNEIYIPNVFSPNDDGINDVFALSFGSDLQVTAMSGSIFDRWGNLVFSSEEIPFQWNGLFAEEQLMPGVYVYVIRCAYLLGSEEKEEVFSGDVTLVR